MSINIIGDAPTVRRLETGLHTFDRSFENRKGEIGFPLGAGVEVFGPTNCGKSTIVYGLADFIAWAKSFLVVATDLQTLSDDFEDWYPDAAIWIDPAGYANYPPGAAAG